MCRILRYLGWGIRAVRRWCKAAVMDAIIIPTPSPCGWPGPGITLGESDELGFNVVKDKVHVHDLHATVLHLLGFDHTRLTYRFQGRDFRLTDVHGNVVKELLA